jgi:hypothetical protein
VRVQLVALCQRWREEQRAWEGEVAALEQEPPVAKEKTNALAERIKTSSAALLDETAGICGYSRQPSDSRRATVWRDNFLLDALPRRFLDPGTVPDRKNWPALANEIEALWRRAVSLQKRIEKIRRVLEDAKPMIRPAQGAGGKPEPGEEHRNRVRLPRASLDDFEILSHPRRGVKAW